MTKKAKTTGHKKHVPVKGSEHKAVVKHSEPPKVEESMHVLVPSPKTLQKEVLTSAIGVIKLLKHHQRYKEIGVRKVALQEDLKNILAEVREMVKVSIGDMPVSLDVLMQHPRFKPIDIPKPRPVERREHPRPKEEPPKPKIPRDKLEADIEMLRDKLSQL